GASTGRCDAATHLRSVASWTTASCSIAARCCPPRSMRSPPPSPPPPQRPRDDDSDDRWESGVRAGESNTLLRTLSRPPTGQAVLAAPATIVVGTAGHIDHGKTSLVKALTGIDTDRLPEEKARGITIDLGFAFLEEPDGLTIEIVDVPGHERFVRNMLAGVGGIDFALLVIAADDRVEIYPRAVQTKVRGLQTHGHPVEEARAGQRTAMNLQGIERAAITRGDVVGPPNALIASVLIDGSLELLKDAPRPLKSRD